MFSLIEAINSSELSYSHLPLTNQGEFLKSSMPYSGSPRFFIKRTATVRQCVSMI